MSGGGAGYDPEADEKDHSEFAGWLQCYYNPDMKNMVDNNRRTIWFSGPAGPMVPKGRIESDVINYVFKVVS